jgi:hypothetical protein
MALTSGDYEAQANRLRSQMTRTVDELRSNLTPSKLASEAASRAGITDLSWHGAVDGADVLVSYLDEHDDANETKRLVEEAGRKCVLVADDLSKSEHCRLLAKKSRRRIRKDRHPRQ